MKVSLADNEKVGLSKVGSVRISVMANGQEKTVKLTDVYYSPILACNIISYGKLDQKGYSLKYSNGKRSIARRRDDQVALDVTMKNSVLIVETEKMSTRKKGTADVIIAAIQEEAADELSSEMHRGSLLHFHQRLGHLSYDAIEKIARNPSWGIELTDHKRMTCITCAQSKQTKTSRTRKTLDRTPQSTALAVSSSRILEVH